MSKEDLRKGGQIEPPDTSVTLEMILAEGNRLAAQCAETMRRYDRNSLVYVVRTHHNDVGFLLLGVVDERLLDRGLTVVSMALRDVSPDDAKSPAAPGDERLAGIPLVDHVLLVRRSAKVLH